MTQSASAIKRSELLDELLLLQRAKRGISFREYVAHVSPKYAHIPRHLERVYDLIEETRHRQVFATIALPPRVGKTTTLSHAIPWRVTCDPACLNIYSTHDQDLARQTSTAARRLTLASGVPLARTDVFDWSTKYGGGLKAASVGGSIMGRGVNGGIAVADDLLKGRAKAESRRERNAVWAWLLDDFLSRLEGGSSFLLINTRWHEDDPTGRLMKDNLGLPFEHIVIPAIADEEGKSVDERLHPEAAVPIWDGIDAANPTREGALEWYRRIRKRGEYSWWSLYQGAPRPHEGRPFGEPARFELSKFSWNGKRGAILLDPAASESTKADYSAFLVAAMEGIGEDARMYVVHVERHQKETTFVAERAVELQRRFKLPLVVESYGGFKSVPQQIRRIKPGLQVIEVPKDIRDEDRRELFRGDKYTRSLSTSAGWKDGRVLVPIDASWDVDTYLDEMLDFSGAGDQHDDQVDVTVMGWNVLYRPLATRQVLGAIAARGA